LKLGGTGHCTVLNSARIATLPAPRSKELTAPLECWWQLIAKVCALSSIFALCVPAAEHRALLLAVEAGFWPAATNIGCGVLQIVKTGRCNVKVRFSSTATMGPWRTPVLLHDNSCPVWVSTECILHQDTFPTTTNPSVVGVGTAATMVVAHQLRQCVRCSPGEPHLFTIQGPSKVNWVLWSITRW